MTHGTRVRYVLGWSLLASLPVLHCEELSIPREYEGRLIQAVRFEPRLQPVTRADLARLLPFQPGARCVMAISAMPSSGSTRPESIRNMEVSATSNFPFPLDRHFDMRFALIALAFSWATAAQNVV